MAGKFLIELTDPRFVIDDNADVIEFIRRVNPFAHSDIASMLFELGKENAPRVLSGAIRWRYARTGDR